ncbi:MAG: hypothetical protein M1833_003564 [Piccolia ochrophora]|nr:MAG: hypothetical protein M1833_003564 [Piccolia ochrophora]
MLNFRTLWLLPCIVLARLAGSSPLEKREDFTVLTPRPGDTVTNELGLLISWTVTNDRPVTILLKVGDPGKERLAKTVNSSTTNNGTYEWRARDDTFLRYYSTRLDYAYSACNYSIELRAGKEVATSGFFTILNEEDGGLPANSTCPEQDGSTTTGESSSTSSTTSTGSTVSLTSLIVGIVVTALILILLFALIILLGRKRGWFVSQAFILQNIPSTSTPVHEEATIPKTESVYVEHSDAGGVSNGGGGPERREGVEYRAQLEA